MAYVPDRFLVVLLSAILTRHFRWDRQGLLILGNVRPTTGNPFPFHWPFQRSHIHFIQSSLSTSFLIGMLGFFESSVAARALAGTVHTDDQLRLTLNTNRELVALGVANLVGGCFMALPAFGGYGRSKVNISTGGKTPMSSVMLSLVTILSVLYLLPYFHSLPVRRPSPPQSIVLVLSLEPWSVGLSHPTHDHVFLRKRFCRR